MGGEALDTEAKACRAHGPQTAAGMSCAAGKPIEGFKAW